jgi:hypothetical protein
LATRKMAAALAGLCGLKMCVVGCASVAQVPPGAPAHVYFEPKHADENYAIQVRAADGSVFACQTPCEMDLASGTAQIGVAGKREYTVEVVVPQGPSRARVSQRSTGGTVLGYAGTGLGAGLVVVGAFSGAIVALVPGVLLAGAGVAGFALSGSNTVAVEAGGAGWTPPGGARPPPAAPPTSAPSPPAAAEAQPAEIPVDAGGEPAEAAAEPAGAAAEAESGAEAAEPTELAEPQSPDQAARTRVRQIMDSQFGAGEHAAAEAKLYEAYNACGAQCSKNTRALIWMYIGIVRGTGKQDQVRARQAFRRMLELDETMSVNSLLADEATLATFEQVREARAKRSR